MVQKLSLLLIGLLTMLLAACGGGSISLGETYDADGVSFKYPSGWVLQKNDGFIESITLANTEAALNAQNASDIMPSGQQAIAVIPRFGATDAIKSPVDMVNQFTGGGFTFGESTEATIGGKPAARRKGNSDKGDVQFIAINMENPTDGRVYVMVWGVTGKGEMGNFEATLNAVAESIMVKPAT